MIGRLKDWRRVATCLDRYPKVFLSAIALATTVIFWLLVLSLVLVTPLFCGFRSEWPRRRKWF
jgi:hypothetical protein